jgi:hypothetical protein
MEGYVGSAPACYGIQTSLKNTKMGDISKGVTNTLLHAQKIYKKTLFLLENLLLGQEGHCLSSNFILGIYNL